MTNHINMTQFDDHRCLLCCCSIAVLLAVMHVQHCNACVDPHWYVRTVLCRRLLATTTPNFA